MSDRPDLDRFERRLADELSRFADVAQDPRPTADIAAAAMRPHGLRRRALPRRTRNLLLVLAAALLLPLSALVVSSRPSSNPDTGTYQAVFERAVPGTTDLDLVLVRTDGQERLLRRIGDTDLPAGWAMAGWPIYASPDGWLSVGTIARGPGDTDTDTYGFAFFDLRDPSPALHSITAYPTYSAWGPEGMFVAACPLVGEQQHGGPPPPQDVCSGDPWVFQVVNAATGEVRVMGTPSLPGGGPEMILAADGSGVLVYGIDDPAWIEPPPEESLAQGGLGIAPFGGGSPTLGVPRLFPRLGPRYFAEGGSQIDRYWTAADGPTPAAITRDARGERTDWYLDGTVAGSLRDASFAADDRSMWVLADDMESGTATLARMSAPGSVDMSRSTSVGVGARNRFIGGLAPDDSLIVLYHDHGQVESPVTLIPTNGQRPTTHLGWLVGYLPSTLADSLIGEGQFQSVQEEPYPTFVPDPSDGLAP